MKRISVVHRVPAKIALVCSLVLTLAHAQKMATGSPNPATVPTDGLNYPWWAARHKALLESVRSQPDAQLLLIGDSIINNYIKTRQPDENFLPTWNEFYRPRKALNLGFSGDTTANVLWRIDHGEVDGLHPKVVMLLIGTNNTAPRLNQTAEQTEAGIDGIIADLERRLPDTKILLLGVLPSDITETKTERDQAINQYLAACYSENSRVTYLDISSIFYKNGVLNRAIFYDPRLSPSSKALHPDTVGQRMMAEAIEPTLAKLMGDTPRVPLSSMTDVNTAVIPVPRLEFDSYDWYARHHAELELQKKMKPRIVLIGDSITHFWDGPPISVPVNGPSAWRKVFGSMSVLNMGFGWDRTQNVLWRLRQGEFDGLRPQWVVLLIGTNNLTGTPNARASKPEEIVDGVDAILRELRRRSPQSQVVLMAILPRGPQKDSPLREPIRHTNLLLTQRFANDPSVTYLDIGAQFLTSDGSLLPTIMPDATHPSEAGYRILADALIKAGVRP